jgi:hypothetical protein
MAKPIPFEQADGVATSHSRDPAIGALPRLSFAASSTSCWKLEPEELAEIQRTGVIWVTTTTFEGLPDDWPQG